METNKEVKYQYRIEATMSTLSPAQKEEKLKCLGEEGWKLCTIGGSNWIFYKEVRGEQ